MSEASQTGVRPTDALGDRSVHQSDDPQTLRRGAVNAVGVLSQAVSEVSPTTSIAVTVGLIAVLAGNGSWLSWILALPVFLLAGYCFSELSKRYSTTGGLPHLVAKVSDARVGLPMGFIITCFGIVFLPFALGVAATYFQNFFHLVGIPGGKWQIVVGAIIGSAVPAWLVYRDVRLAANFMIGTELISVALIVLLLIIVLFGHHGGPFDHAQLHVQGVSFHAITLGAVFSCLCFVGFESTITFGQEAANPKRSIPFSLYGVLIGGGLLFIVSSYVMQLGFAGFPHRSLATSANPLQDLSHMYGVSWLNYPLQAAVVVALIAVALGFINFSARMLYTYAREGLLPKSLARVGKTTKTPVNAVLAIFAFTNIVFWFLFAVGKDTLTQFGYVSTAITLMYVLGYVIGLLAIAWFMGRTHVKVGVAAVLAAAGFAYITYNNLSPMPAAPQNVYDFIALGLVVVAVLGSVVLGAVRPDIVRRFGSTTDADTALADRTTTELEMGLSVEDIPVIEGAAG